jgi:tetratricopeptide (TPR) repeat protein
MDIDEFLDKELKKEKDHKQEKDEVSSDKKDSVDQFFELWNRILKTKFKWDDKLYTDISTTGEKVKRELDNIILAVGRQKKAIKRLIGKALDEIENKNYDTATKIYSEVSDMRKKIPEFMLEEKKELSGEIFSLYAKLHNNIDAKFVKDFKISLLEIEKLIEGSNSAMESGDLEKSKVIYVKALEGYKALPKGFLQKKIDLGSNLLGLYKELSIRTQIYELQDQLSSGSFSYASADRLRKLSEIVKSKNLPTARATISSQGHIPSKTLLSSLISRKLERARINLEKGSYDEARKNLQAVLNVDPRNSEAKELLNKIPVKP